MTTVAVQPAEPGSWWLVLLGGLAGQAARVAEADRGRAALLATVSHDLRAPLAAAKAAVSGLRACDARLTADDPVPATTAESKALAKALKAKGFAFVGPTTAYAAMQACGLVDDHIAGCPVAAANDA